MLTSGVQLDSVLVSQAVSTDKTSDKEKLDDYFADPYTFGTFDKRKDADDLGESPLDSPKQKSMTVEEGKENDKVHMW